MAKKKELTAQEKLVLERKAIQIKIDKLTEERDNTLDPKRRKRLTAEIKSQTRKKNDLNQRPAAQRTGIDPKGGSKKRVNPGKGKQLHHKASLNNLGQFFEGLDVPEKIIMEKAFANFGIVGGDLTMNAIALFEELHQGGIHKFERAAKLEGKEYFRKGATFQEKLNAVEQAAADQRYLKEIAERAQFRAEYETEGLSRRVLETPTAEASQQYQETQKKYRSESSRDILEYGRETHNVAGTQQRRPRSEGAVLPELVIENGKAVTKGNFQTPQAPEIPKPTTTTKPTTKTTKTPRIKPRFRAGAALLNVGEYTGSDTMPYRVDTDPLGDGLPIMLP